MSNTTMSNTTTTSAGAAAGERTYGATGKGITLPCPCCHEQGATVTLNLAEGGLFFCNECNEEFGDDVVRELIAAARKWERVLAWMGGMPSDDE